VLAEPIPEEVAAVLTRVQHELFDLGGELSIPGYAAIDDGHVGELEKNLDHFNADLPPLKEFILPGGERAAALAHVCRATCRRAERRLVRLALSEQVSPLPQRYVNRLSDLLFVLCRVLNRSAGRSDVYWQKSRAPDA
jgi:cob(I)alamin adenosyltransferase